MAFTPIISIISDITQANPAVVTTTTNHNLFTGEVVRINLPKQYGMQELNHQIGIISVLSSTKFSLYESQVPVEKTINSTNYSAFTNVGTGTPPQVIPIGSGPIPITDTPPQKLNNVCQSTLVDAYSNISVTEIPF